MYETLVYLMISLYYMYKHVHRKHHLERRMVFENRNPKSKT